MEVPHRSWSRTIIRMASRSRGRLTNCSRSRVGKRWFDLRIGISNALCKGTAESIPHIEYSSRVRTPCVCTPLQPLCPNLEGHQDQGLANDTDPERPDEVRLVSCR